MDCLREAASPAVRLSRMRQHHCMRLMSRRSQLSDLTIDVHRWEAYIHHDGKLVMILASGEGDGLIQFDTQEEYDKYYSLGG